MESREDPINLFRFEDPRQKRIYEKLLRLVGPGAASFYQDACRLMEIKPPLETTTHLVAHSLREIESALRDVLEPIAEQANSLEGKKSKGGNNHRTEILSVLKGLGIPETDSIAQAWLKTADQGNNYRLHARAHRNALTTPHPPDEGFLQFWNDMEAMLDVVLDKFESAYVSVFKFLDELLVKPAPSQNDVKKLRDHIPNNQVAFSYFFDKLTSPTWLEPLKTGGFFNQPPEPIRKGEYIQFPIWPESRYLERMASHAPKVVLDVILKIFPTDNVRVHEDLINAALEMPANLAAKIAPHAKKWLESPYHLRLLDGLGKLISHLAKGKETETALDLARTLLAVQPDDRTDRKVEVEGKTHHFLPEPRARFDTWEYQEILEKDVPELVTAGKEKAVSLLCELLASAIQLSQRDTTYTGPEDRSYIWRRAIEDHEQNRSSNLKNILTTATRNAVEQLAQTDPTRIPSLIELLEKQKWNIFHRIALHLLRVRSEGMHSLISERLANHAIFDEEGLWHEYVLLAREQFCNLSSADQQTLLSWINEGPDLKAFEDCKKEVEGRSPTIEEIERHKKYWQLKRLAPLKDVLPPEWGKRYNELVVELGEPEHPGLVSYSTSWVGPTSPKSAAVLGTMTAPEIIEFLKTWQPPDDPWGPSREGLGRALTPLVSSDPERFVIEAKRFRELDPPYVRALLAGFQSAVIDWHSFSWSPVLELCLWVVNQPREIPEYKGEYADLDPGWVWTRTQIVRLLSEGLKAEQNSAAIPLTLRSLVWAVLAPITDDPNPTPEEEDRHNEPDMDASSLSINTTRGEAMHTVIRYALWVRRHIEKEPEGIERLKHGFEEMPEVREVLEVHLDPAQDPSLAIRSVYGQWFPWLVLLDQQWAAAHVVQIFPTDETHADLRNAAWEAYITLCDPYKSAFDILREEYGRTIEHLVDATPRRPGRDASNDRLAEHLAILYYNGHLALDSQNGLFLLFYEKAPQALHSHIIEFIGRNAHNWRGALSSEVINRLKALWEWRFATIQKTLSPASHSAELASFGWWFSSGKFDDDWALLYLTQVLKLLGQTKPDRWPASGMVAERLAVLAKDFPRESVECLRLMVDATKEPWYVTNWREHPRIILSTGLQSSDTQTQEAAENLVNRLMALGHFEFRNLLQK